MPNSPSARTAGACLIALWAAILVAAEVSFGMTGWWRDVLCQCMLNGRRFCQSRDRCTCAHLSAALERDTQGVPVTVATACCCLWHASFMTQRVPRGLGTRSIDQGIWLAGGGALGAVPSSSGGALVRGLLPHRQLHLRRRPGELCRSTAHSTVRTDDGKPGSRRVVHLAGLHSSCNDQAVAAAQDSWGVRHMKLTWGCTGFLWMVTVMASRRDDMLPHGMTS